MASEKPPSPNPSTTQSPKDAATPPALTECTRSLSDVALQSLSVLCSPNGEGFLQIEGSTTVHSLKDPRTKLLLARHMSAAGSRQRPAELQALIDDLNAYAQTWAPRRAVWQRVAPIEGGIELDVGDDADTRIRVTAGGVVIDQSRGGPLFHRTPTMRPYVLPTPHGNLDLIDDFLNLSFEDRVLFKIWLAFTLAQTRVPSTVYVILLLLGPQGSGKSLLCQMLVSLINPSSVVIQSLPRNPLDLAIATQQSPLNCFDNCRTITPWMSDAFCMASTGGVVTGRRLYSDDAQAAVSLHGPVVVNTLHGIVTEADLAERCLQLNLQPLDAEARRDPALMLRQFEDNLPTIFAGLLSRISEILARLPQVEPTKPARVYAFSRWLAAAEQVDGATEGSYQRWYSESLSQTMLETLQESPIATVLLDFMDLQPDGRWSGTAAELLDALNRAVRKRGYLGPEWPANEIALSRRLRALVAAFRGQGVDIRFTRGRRRLIIIVRSEDPARH